MSQTFTKPGWPLPCKACTSGSSEPAELSGPHCLATYCEQGAASYHLLGTCTFVSPNPPAAGQEVEVDMENDSLTDIASGRVFKLKPLGEVSFGSPAALPNRMSAL